MHCSDPFRGWGPTKQPVFTGGARAFCTPMLMLGLHRRTEWIWIGRDVFRLVSEIHVVELYPFAKAALPKYHRPWHLYFSEVPVSWLQLNGMFSFANGCSNNKRGICKLLGDLVQNEPNHVKDYFLLVLYIKPSPRIPLGSSPDEFPWCAGLLAVGLSSLPPSLLFKHQLEHHLSCEAFYGLRYLGALPPPILLWAHGTLYFVSLLDSWVSFLLGAKYPAEYLEPYRCLVVFQERKKLW